MRWLTNVLIVTVAALSITISAYGQTVSGSMSGVVKDSDGAVIQAAAVKLESLAVGRVFSVMTDERGRFRFSHLAVGDYKLTVSKENYQQFTIERFKVSLGAQDFLGIELKVASEFAGETVITAEAPLIETTKSTVDTVISRDIVDNLPLVERDFMQLLLTLNGVQELDNVMTGSTGDKGGISISGARVRDNIFQVDGADNNSSLTGKRQQFYSLDVIEEVQLSTAAYSAEYGRGSGGIINVVTKSGTDTYSGRFSYYLRDDSLDQNSDEDLNWRYQEFSVTYGGPIQRKKLYFLVNFNRITRNDSRDFILDHFVEPMALQNEKRQNAFFGKINWFANINHEFTFTGNYEPSKLNQPLTNGFRPERDGYTVEEGGLAFTGSHLWTLSDSALLQTRFNVKKIKKDRRRNTPSDEPVGILWFVPSESGRGSLAAYEGPAWYNSINDEFGFTIAEKFQYLTGETKWGIHSLSIGGDFGYTSLDAEEELYNKYYNLRGVLPPERRFYYRIESFGDPNINFSQTVASAYVQDDWQVNQRLTLNVGARIDYNDFLENTVASPRFGFAFDPVGDQKTVIRGGAGIYYTKNFSENQRTVEQPLTRTYLDFSGNFDNPRPITSVYRMASDIKTPRTVEASIGFERLLAGNMTFGVTATYRKNEDLFYMKFTNLRDADTGQRANPDENLDIRVYGNQGWSNYRALLFTFNKRFSHRWTLRADYTWSRSEGNSSRYTPTSLTSRLWSSQQNQDEWINGEGPTDFDAPHSLKLTALVRLPFDIMMSGFYNIRSGYPFSVQEDFRSIPEPINTERLPHYKKLDIRLQKSVGFGERYKLHIYFDMLNALNDQNVAYVSRFQKNFNGTPNENYLQPSFYHRERESQIGIKFDF